MRRTLVGLAVLICLAAAFVGLARYVGIIPTVIRPARDYYDVDQAFTHPRAWPSQFTVRAVVTAVDHDEEVVTVMDMGAFASCSAMTCGLYYIPLYLPRGSGNPVPGVRVPVRYRGVWPEARALVFADGRIVRYGKKYVFVVDEMRDARGKVIVTRVR